MNQSRPRWLCGDGGGRAATGSGTIVPSRRPAAAIVTIRTID